MTFGVVFNHEGESQIIATISTDWGYNNTRAVTNDEGDLFWRCKLRSHDEIAFILAIFIINHHNHLAARNCGNDIFDRCKLKTVGHDFSSFVRGLSIVTSISDSSCRTFRSVPRHSCCIDGADSPLNNGAPSLPPMNAGATYST